MEPTDEVLAQFGVKLVASLGGRINQHWLVKAQREQFVLRCWGQSPLIRDPALQSASINYEVLLLRSLAALGWPVAPPVAGPVKIAGHVWSLAPFLFGEVPASANSIHGGHEEQRARGRLLAEFHAGLAQVPPLGQRPGWRRCEEVLADSMLDETLTQNEPQRSEEVRILRWHLEQAREQTAGPQLQDRPGLIIHGDFTPWNLRFAKGRLSGILDFELAHWDHRAGDFVLSWRGKYDEFVLGYAEVSPLEPEEWELITPLWWANLVHLACVDMNSGIQGDDWVINKLLLRSPLMGRNAQAFPE